QWHPSFPTRNHRARLLEDLPGHDGAGGDRAVEPVLAPPTEVARTPGVVGQRPGVVLRRRLAVVGRVAADAVERRRPPGRAVVELDRGGADLLRLVVIGPRQVPPAVEGVLLDVGQDQYRPGGPVVPDATRGQVAVGVVETVGRETDL